MEFEFIVYMFMSIFGLILNLFLSALYYFVIFLCVLILISMILFCMYPNQIVAMITLVSEIFKVKRQNEQIQKAAQNLQNQVNVRQVQLEQPNEFEKNSSVSVTDSKNQQFTLEKFKLVYRCYNLNPDKETQHELDTMMSTLSEEQVLNSNDNDLQVYFDNFCIRKRATLKPPSSCFD